MPDLSFAVDSVDMVPFAVAPTLSFKLRVTNALVSELIHTIVLRAQIQIEATRRRYDGQDQERLLDLFGEPQRYPQTLRSMLWTFASTTVRPFSGNSTTDLAVHCTYDFNVASAKYFYALESGEVTLAFLFSGTVFYETEDGRMQVSQIPWEKEAGFQLPVRVWKEMMAHYYPNMAWLALRTDVFDRLYRFKIQRALPTWEQVIETMLNREDGDGGETPNVAASRGSPEGVTGTCIDQSIDPSTEPGTDHDLSHGNNKHNGKAGQ